MDFYSKSVYELVDGELKIIPSTLGLSFSPMGFEVRSSSDPESSTEAPNSSLAESESLSGEGA